MSNYGHQFKIDARDRLVNLWRTNSGLQCLPLEQSYWSLCHDQTSSPSEIEQLRQCGFLTEGQFHGVDRDLPIILANRNMYPNDFWHHGNWIPMLTGNESLYNPGLVYYDTTEGPSVRLARDFDFTIQLAHRGAIVALNVMLRIPLSGQEFDEDEMPKLIAERMRHRMPKPLDVYKYSSSHTPMATYVYAKR